jgi:diguanylate cyclase (GGDEF)-like protein
VIPERSYNATILIVDDHPTNLQVLLDSLQNSGYRTLIARNGEGAIKQAAFAQPDLILLDVMMPGIDGFETCQRLKQQDVTCDIPVIFMTALVETVDKVRGFEAGGVDYITKPFDQAELLARVKAHLELRRYQGELQRSNQQLAKANAELQEAQQQLELAARTDPLTQLSNRRDMIEKLDYEKVRHKRSQQAFALILSDIDDFKMFNDTYGHDCGDFILVSVADVMRSMLREQDQLARWGGEEFLVMLLETDLQRAGIVAEKIRETIATNLFLYKGLQLSVSMTFGVSVFDTFEKSIDGCIKKADLALYRGKDHGKNRVVLFDSAQFSEERTL